jgi:hypothetical protein
MTCFLTKDGCLVNRGITVAMAQPPMLTIGHDPSGWRMQTGKSGIYPKNQVHLIDYDD